MKNYKHFYFYRIYHLASNLFLSLFYLIRSDQSYLNVILLDITKAATDIPPLIIKRSQKPKLLGIILMKRYCKKLEHGNAKNIMP